MTTRRKKQDMTRLALDDTANALQAAALLSTELRQKVGIANVVSIELEAAVDRAVRAMKRLQPTAKARS